MAHEGEILKLKIKGSGLTIENAASAVGLSRKTLYNYFAMTTLPAETKDLFKEKLSIDITQNVTTPINFHKALSEKKNGKTLDVPVFDIDFSLGFREQIRDNPVAKIGSLSIPEVQGCDYVIRAKGDSMADYINDRDWVGIKRIHDYEVIAFGNPYALVTSELQLIKYIEQSQDDDMWTLMSENKRHKPFDIPKVKVLELYIVRAVLPFSRIKTFI